jgi:hypothetical protein
MKTGWKQVVVLAWTPPTLVWTQLQFLKRSMLITSRPATSPHSPCAVIINDFNHDPCSSGHPSCHRCSPQAPRGLRLQRQLQATMKLGALAGQTSVGGQDLEPWKWGICQLPCFDHISTELSGSWLKSLATSAEEAGVAPWGSQTVANLRYAQPGDKSSDAHKSSMISEVHSWWRRPGRQPWQWSVPRRGECARCFSAAASMCISTRMKYKIVGGRFEYSSLQITNWWSQAVL